MSFTVSGTDGVLTLLAVLCFAVAAVVAWVSPGHRLYFVLLAVGAFLLALTGIVH